MLSNALGDGRALSSTSVLAIFGGAWLVSQAIDWAAKRASALATLAPFALCMPFCSVFWAVVTPAEAQPNAFADHRNCRVPEAFGSLRALPTSVLMAPIDMGSEILANTRHSVLAAPYHRDNHGNRQMVDAMLAEPGAAHEIVRASGAGYVVFCPAMPDVAIYAAASPHGLAAALLSGETPDWLAPEPIGDQPYRVYKVR